MLSAALVALTGIGEVCAQSTNFTYTGSLQTFKTTTSGYYYIVATGASGGIFPQHNISSGVSINGYLYLSSGTSLNVAVGGMGDISRGSVYGGSSGGGGGTFIFTTGGGSNTPIMVAGGGGGAGILENPKVGGAFTNQTDPSPSHGKYAYASGGNISLYNGATYYGYGAGGGAGFYSDGQSSGKTNQGAGGKSLLSLSGGGDTNSNSSDHGGCGGYGPGRRQSPHKPRCRIP